MRLSGNKRFTSSACAAKSYPPSLERKIPEWVLEYHMVGVGCVVSLHSLMMGVQMPLLPQEVLDMQIGMSSRGDDNCGLQLSHKGWEVGGGREICHLHPSVCLCLVDNIKEKQQREESQHCCRLKSKT